MAMEEVVRDMFGAEMGWGEEREKVASRGGSRRGPEQTKAVQQSVWNKTLVLPSDQSASAPVEQKRRKGAFGRKSRSPCPSASFLRQTTSNPQGSPPVSPSNKAPPRRPIVPDSSAYADSLALASAM